MNTYRVEGDALIESDTPAVVLSRRALRAERHADTCTVCGGPCFEQRTVCDEFTGVWLHLRREDWSEQFGATPHNVERAS